MRMLGPDVPGTWSSPYRGLAAFNEKHAAYFFGREDDAYLIAANALSADVFILYGASGVGKSSLLGAALPRALKRILSNDPPLVIDVRRWDCGFYRTLLERAKREGWEAYERFGEKYRRSLNDRRQEEDRLNTAEGPSVTPPLEENTFRESGEVTGRITLTRLAKMWARGVGTPVLFIFDQFEQYFISQDFGTNPEDARFEADLARVVKERDLNVHVLISIREDALFQLNRLRARIPEILAHSLKLNHLDQNSATKAIELPLGEWLKDHGPNAGPTSAAPGLVATLIGQVSSPTGDGARIETAFLQLALTRLWEEERRQGSRELRLETLNALGGAAGIIDSHFQDTMRALPEDEQRLCAAIFDPMVTPSGMKIAMSAEDIANLAKEDQKRVLSVLDKLANGPSRIINSVRSPDNKTLLFEIFHDVLARPILDWKRQIAVRRAARERGKKRLWMAGCALAIAALFILIGRELVIQHARSLADQANFASDRGDGRLALLAALQANGTSWLHDVLGLIPEASTSALARAVYRPVGPVLAGHEQRLRDLAYSPDGKLIATASRDRTARLWKAENGKLRPNGVLKHGAEVSSVAFDAKGEHVITTSDDGWVRIWTLAGEELTRWHHDAEGSAARVAEFSPAGGIIVTAGRTGSVRIWRWDGTEYKPTAVNALRQEDVEWQAAVTSLAFDPKGERLITAAREQRARIWDMHTGKLVQELPLCPDKKVESTDDVVMAARFSPDGKRAVIGSREGRSCIWELATAPDGELKSRHPLMLNGHDDRVTAVEFDRKGERVVTASADGTVRLWDAFSGEMLRRMQGPAGGSGSRGLMALDPGGQRVVASFSERVAHLWSLSTGLEVRKMTKLQGKPTAIAASRDDRRLAVADDSTISVIDVDSGGKVVEDIVSDLPALSIAFDNGSDRLAVANGSAADIWDLDGKRAHRLYPPLAKHNSLVLSIAYDPSGRQLVTASQDGTARIWDAETRAPGKILSGHAKAVFAALFNADGRRVVTGSFDGTVRLWNAATGKQIGDSIRIGHPVLALSATNDDGEFVVTSLEESSPTRLSRTRTAVWDVRSGKEVWSTRRTAASSEDEATVQKRASRLIKTSSDGDLLVMDGRQDVLAMLPSNGNKLVGLAGGASRDFLYTVFEDGSVRAWQLVPSDPYGLVGYAREIAKETLSADQQSLTSDEQRDLGIWQGPVWLNVGVLMGDALMRWAQGLTSWIQSAGQ